MEAVGPMRDPRWRFSLFGAVAVVVVIAGGGLAADPRWEAAAVRIGTEDGRSAAVDALVAPYDLDDGPGGVLGVYLDGRLLYARGYGLANLEYGIPNTPSTVFRVGSVSKQFAAMAIAILAERGKLRLDDDIRKHLPEIPSYPEGVVTIRHLVHHTSGLRDYNELARYAGYRSDQLSTTEAAFELLKRQRGLNFPPGERFLYSNSGYFLIGVLVERVTGKTLAEFAHAEIFEPLGMSSSRFKDDHGAVIAERAYGYLGDRDGDGWRLYLSQRDFVGAGGVFTTVEDMRRWFLHLDTGDAELLGRMSERGVLTDGTELSYAFGLNFDEDRGLSRVHHSGGFAAFTAHTVRYPDQGLAVFTAVNGGAANAVRLALEIADIYLRPLVAGLAPLEFPVPGAGAAPDDPATNVQLTADELAGYVGTFYGSEVDATFEVGHAPGGLVLTIPGMDPVHLRARGQGVFESPRLTITFERAGTDPAGRFTLYGNRASGLLFERTD